MDNFLKLLKSIAGKIKEFYQKNGELTIPTAVLAVICIVVTLALSSTNLLTAAKIDSLAFKAQNEAMAKLIVADEYNAATEKFSDEITYYIAVKDGTEIGYIFTVSAKGYGGDVSVMTAVKPDGTVAAVDILDASGETPGLGGNVTKESFYTQYQGLKIDITVNKNEANKENNQIKAVTGATISSNAVTTAVNQALEYAKQIIEKGAAK